MAESHEVIDLGNDVTRLHDSCVVQATIVEVDYTNDTCTIDLGDGDLREDVPIFFHCEGKQDTEDGSYAFLEGDEVVVLKKKNIGSGHSLTVVALKNELRLCDPAWESWMKGFQGLHKWEAYYVKQTYVPSQSGCKDYPEGAPENKWKVWLGDGTTSQSGDPENDIEVVVNPPDEAYLRSESFWGKYDYDTYIRLTGSEPIPCPDRQEHFGLLWTATEEDPPIVIEERPYLYLEMRLKYDMYLFAEWGDGGNDQNSFIVMRLNGVNIPHVGGTALSDVLQKSYPATTGVSFFLERRDSWDHLAWNKVGLGYRLAEEPNSWPMPGAVRIQNPEEGVFAPIPYDPNEDWSLIPKVAEGAYTYDPWGCGMLQEFRWWPGFRWWAFPSEPYYSNFRTIFDIRPYLGEATEISSLSLEWNSSGSQKIMMRIEKIDFKAFIPEELQTTWVNR